MFKPLHNSGGWRCVGSVVVCPVCERRSVYNRVLDRFFHCDGADNRFCWVAITSGRLVPQPILAGDERPVERPVEGPGRAA